ncbi:hypothetical protein [Sphingobium sp. LB126]|uniref:hypothetical protein n=1 Tax=Sphingobium sp. LB126 TaxID=1983755 RepID=UPI001F5BAEE0|nr:hypothetical protein [Sphingobium sp. LB126]
MPTAPVRSSGLRPKRSMTAMPSPAELRRNSWVRARVTPAMTAVSKPNSRPAVPPAMIALARKLAVFDPGIHLSCKAPA